MKQIILIILFFSGYGITNAQLSMDPEVIKTLGLPVIEITTENAEEPTCEPIEAPAGCDGISITNVTKVSGRLKITKDNNTIFDSGDYKKDVSGIKIKIRGNTSSAFEKKKSFKINLEKKADLLFRSATYKDKDWILLNEGGGEIIYWLGFKLNQLFGMPWTPAHEYVNLIINGNYRGIYMLVESVKQNKNCRINVDNKTGYIIENDAYWWNELITFESMLGRHYTFKYPKDDDVSEFQKTYIKTAINKMEVSIIDGTYESTIDVKSFATWLLAHDIMNTRDAGGSNIYIAKYSNSPESKFFMPTLWDFGGCFLSNTQSWSNIHTNERYHYYSSLLKSKNPAFRKIYKELWEQKGRNAIDLLTEATKDFLLSQEGKALTKSQPYDSQRWGWKEEVDFYNNFITELPYWLSQRKIFLETKIKEISVNTAINNIRISRDSSFFHTPYTITGEEMPKNYKGIFIKMGKKYLKQ